ncbi:hypothetical protein EC968_005771 [Mortierella alpina]|nr:hypothetical protein EC968_005771 [Mortierella alpina]
MKKILDARGTKSKELKSIITAYDTIRVEADKLEHMSPNSQQRAQDPIITLRTNGNRSYQQPVFLNIPSHWPRFRGPAARIFADNKENMPISKGGRPRKLQAETVEYLKVNLKRGALKTAVEAQQKAN